jgi:hypothetical protein
MESRKNAKTAIRTQDPCWSKFHNISLKKPSRPIDRLMKSLGKKTTEEHITDKTCASCFKYIQIIGMTADHIREWGISGMCKSCQDEFFLEN